MLRKKILALHGGGSSGSALRQSQGFKDLQDAVGDAFEFVTPDAPDGLWMRDPPGGKTVGTTDPGWADDTLAFIDSVVAEHGPFYGILGFSQGAAFVPVYLTHTTAAFKAAYLYAGYLPTLHQGLMQRIDERAPFTGIPAFVWMGAQDRVIPNELSQRLANTFETNQVIVDSQGTHDMPMKTHATFAETVRAFTKDTSTGAAPQHVPLLSVSCVSVLLMVVLLL